jgi:hypothetical protein
LYVQVVVIGRPSFLAHVVFVVVVRTVVWILVALIIPREAAYAADRSDPPPIAGVQEVELPFKFI